MPISKCSRSPNTLGALVTYEQNAFSQPESSFDGVRVADRFR